MRPYPIDIPKGSLIANEHNQIDYQDAFAIKVPSTLGVPPEELVKVFFNSFPTWGKVLMSIRERIASRLGLKTAKGLDIEKQMQAFEGQPGQSLALFHVKERTDTEILTGERDKHLDFSLSVIGRYVNMEFEMILATTVIFNNRLGRLYFLPVKPIHRLLVPAMLKRMALKLSK